MASATAPVGHNGGGPLHDRLPVGVGHVGHQNVTRLHLVHFADVVHHPNRASANFLANCAALDDNRAFAFELVTVFSPASCLTLHCLRTGLQNVQFTVQSVFTPLNVHRPTVVLLDHQGVSRQLLYIGVGQGVPVAQFGGHIRCFDQLATDCFFLGCGELHLDQFGTQTAPDEGALARPQHGFVHIKLIRVHGTLHHRLAQPVAGGNEHHILKTGLGVNGEHDACRAQVGAHHALNTGAQSHMLMGKTLVHAVTDRSVVVKTGKHLPDFVQHLFNTRDIQKSFLLAGKGGIRQILGGSRRAHGERGCGVVSTQSGKRHANSLFKVSGKWLDFHHGPDLGTDAGQSFDVLGVECTQAGVDSTGEVLKGQKITKGVRRRCKTCGDLDAGG